MPVTVTRNGTANADRRRPRGDLRPAPMVVLTVDDWRNPGAALDTLRHWVENEAAEAINWYLRDKNVKRLGSRILRALAIVLAVAGGVAPLLATGRQGAANWGYVLLALAAGCVAFDHFFGLSSGWMRDIATVQSLQRRLSEFRFAWIAANADQALGNGRPVDVPQRLALIERFAGDLGRLVSNETGEWLTEFQANISRLDGQSKPAATPTLTAPAPRDES